MNLYFNLRTLPELQDLTQEQRLGVCRKFRDDHFFIFAALAGGIGAAIALILSGAFDLSIWARSAAASISAICGQMAYFQYKIRLLRPKIADYVFIHFRKK